MDDLWKKIQLMKFLILNPKSLNILNCYIVVYVKAKTFIGASPDRIL